ncbi:MAG: tetratricopeptide repeat protein [Terracidiphilus sp.]|nr:tetratricopeptide repeat protein [Terracidiphilus sp.]MDR3776972.1 tetratricopeptide repeat protein [Terracidiphilus sp.]
MSASMNRPGTATATAHAERAKAAVSIDYPEDGSIFPPGITPPTFLWRDAAATSWKIDVTFGNNAPAIHAESKGERIHIGAIDPEAVSKSNEPPSLTAQQAASWTWIPDAATWSVIQLHATKQPATLTITGYRDGQIASAPAHISFTTSTDPVGAPIFYRDVPLMPSKGKDGTIQPLSISAIHLIRWRLRDIHQASSPTVLTDLPTCVNCHSFSADGKTMGIDVDGPNNDKGLYAIVPTQRQMTIQNKDVVQWNTDGQVGTTRVGFMSQVSPDGRYVVSTFSPPSLDFPRSYYTTNFNDYRFLQAFFPTKGILGWYSSATGKRQPLPGADDPHYVQTGGVWSPDGKYIVFARAVAKEPRTAGQKPALHSNDPNETQIQYDLYRIPFNDGKGGTAERIVGASQNGMSNSFPKISPDGRWIVFVQAHDGEVMRPDSQLYMVPFGGGVARRLRANTPRMNSWHSFSPNGRWLVFSSKGRSPYTQMYLTHIDANGNDSPAILIDNATAANRAVNLPEFVNIAGDGIESIKVPAVDVYQLMGQAIELEEQKEYGKALEVWKKAVTLAPDDASVQNDLGVVLYLNGDMNGAIEHLREAVRINPLLVSSHFNLGQYLSEQGHPDQALPELETTLNLNPRFPAGEEALADVYSTLGKNSEALAHWHKALALKPKSVNALVGTARILSSSQDAALRNGTEAVTLAETANTITSGSDPSVLDTLAAAYAETGKFPQALATANHALALAVEKKDSAMADTIRYRINLYTEKKPYRN